MTDGEKEQVSSAGLVSDSGANGYRTDSRLENVKALQNQDRKVQMLGG